jgi:hypothetical protein
MRPAITGGPVSKKSHYWKTAGVLLLASFLLIAIDGSNDPAFECDSGDTVAYADVNDGFRDCVDGSDEGTPEADAFENSDGGLMDTFGAIGALSCCGSFVFIILALSAKNQQVIYLQQGFVQPAVQPVIQQQIIHSPVPAPQPQAPMLQPAAPVAQMGSKSSSPQDLERARDFGAAADEYQRLGMYAEAGRVRAMHLEKEQPLVSIGSVGDTILNDSVMVSNEGSTQNGCPSCGKEVSPDFNMCPYCKYNL